MAKKHRKGPRRRANSPSRGRHPKGAEEGTKNRVKRQDREAEMEYRRQHQAIAPDGGKAKPLRAVEPKQKIRNLRHRGPRDGMALRTTPTPCSQPETAGGPRRGPSSETSLGGNCQRELGSTGESPERHQG